MLANILANAYMVHFPELYNTKISPKSGNSKPYVSKTTGSMSNPSLGMAMLVLIATMLFLMDSWLGIGWLSLTLFGRAYDWSAAYGPLHKKIDAMHEPKSSPRTSSSNESGGGGGGVDLEEK